MQSRQDVSLTSVSGRLPEVMEIMKDSRQVTERLLRVMFRLFSIVQPCIAAHCHHCDITQEQLYVTGSCCPYKNMMKSRFAINSVPSYFLFFILQEFHIRMDSLFL